MSTAALPSTRRQRVTEIGVPVVAATILAVGLAGGHKKSLIAVIGGIAIIGMLILSARRERVMVAFLTVSMAFILHKSFGAIALENGGAPSIYISTVGVCVLLLYGCWFLSGDMGADLRRGIRHWVLAAPVVGMALMLPSLLISPAVRLGVAEELQLGILYLLFVYVALRVNRRDVAMILVLLAGVTLLEGVAALGQWVTHGPLGLSFLGLPSELGQRVTADGILGRPFGTITHPVFLGAFVGQLGLLFLSLAVVAQRRWERVAAMALATCAGATIAVAQARSAALGFAVATLVIVVVSLAVRRMQWRTVRRGIVAVLVLAVLTSPLLIRLYHVSLFTDHFSLEVQARGQLLDLGWHIFASRPFLGTGLNSFQQVMDSFATTSLIFDGNPVHNIYVLQAAETGVVGVLAIPVVALSLLWVAVRAARSPDRLGSGLGIALIAVMTFLGVEELFVFSLREDHPRSLFWLLAGLTVAAARFAGLVPGSDGGEPADPDAGPRLVRRAWAWLTPPLVGAPARPARTRPAAVVLATVAAQAGPTTANRRGARKPRAAAAPAFVRGIGSQRRRSPWTTPGAAFLAITGLVASILAGTVTLAPPAAAAHLQVVLSLTDRGTGGQGLYVANGDGSGLHPITATGAGTTYGFADWTPGGRRLTYSSDTPTARGQLFLAAGDGSHSVQLTSTPWQNGQPHMSPDGRSLLFTAAPPDLPLYGLFRMDIASGLVTNLSARNSTSAAVDTDPNWSPNGRNVVFVEGARPRDTGVSAQPSQVYTMAADGTGRVAVTHDDHYNVDPVYSPDGRTIAFSSYHGTHPANSSGTPGPLTPTVKLDDFFLVTHDLATGAERVFNKGDNCALRDPADPCAPLDGPAYLPKYLPGGKSLAYLGILDRTTVCVCAVDTDGGNPRVLLAFAQQTVNWFDFTIPGDEPATAATPHSADPTDRLLILTHDAAGHASLTISTSDYWTRVPVQLPKGLHVLKARWGSDAHHVLLTARTATVDPATLVPTPAAPRGRARQRHFTLDMLPAGTSLALRAPAPADRARIDRQQVFDLDIMTGTVAAVTTAGTEDWLDAIPDGAWRGNGEAMPIPHSHAVVFTNYASDTAESFLLRKDLVTGAVRSLTNATSGALPVSDSQPAVSPDGKTVAFVTGHDGGTDLAVMSAKTGNGYRLLTDDAEVKAAPAWGPDGSWLVYASLRAGQWSLVRLDVASGRHTVLVQTYGQAQSPVVSPDGKRIAYISFNHNPAQPDVQIVDSDGGNAHPLQITLPTTEVSLDWR